MLWRFERGHLPRHLASIGLLALTVLQLVHFLRLWYPSNDTSRFPLYPETAITTFLEHHANDGRYAIFRDTAKDPIILPSNSSDVYGTYDWGGYESLTPRTINSMMRQSAQTDSMNLRLLGLANVRYLITRSRTPSDHNALLVDSAEGLRIYENKRAKPRAYFVQHVQLVPEQAIVREMLDSSFSGASALLSEGDDDTISGTFDDRAQVEILHSEDEAMTLHVRNSARSFLVVTDTYYPGWHCTVDGLTTTIYRVNEAMRGVMIEPGIHRIQFEFQPGLFAAGLGLSAIALIAILLTLIVMRFRR
jgi:hypothetical protein